MRRDYASTRIEESVWQSIWRIAAAHAVIFNAASFRSKKRLTILIVSPLNL